MAFTIGEIAKEVLQEIGRLPDGQVAPASQIKTVERAYAMLYDELLNNSLVNWAADDDIPDFAANHIIIILAGRVSGRFGVPDIWTPREGSMMNLLAQQLASPYIAQPTRFGDF
jgi:hypothetical protein